MQANLNRLSGVTNFLKHEGWFTLSKTNMEPKHSHFDEHILSDGLDQPPTRNPGPT